MLHETLFYLLNSPPGFTGNEDVEIYLDMLELQDFIHPSEKKLLERILNIGCKYLWIDNVMKSSVNFNLVSNNIYVEKDSIIKYESKTMTESKKVGLYVQAFYQGVDTSLEDYRKNVIKLEELILNNVDVNLTFILSEIEKYDVLLDTLKAMICTIQNENLKGCQIIGKLHKYLNFGNELVVKAVTKIIQIVNVIFLRQLCNWIIYGDLLDENDEFFICDGKDFDENFIRNESTNIELTKYPRETFSKRNKLKSPSPIRRFYLKEEFFPFSNHKHLAEIILFMGQIVWIISNGPEEKEKLNFRYRRDVWEGKSIETYKKIQELGNQPLNLTKFELVIEECRLNLAKFLWNVMVEEAHLLDHLQLVRDYYCVGRGELFQQFIISAENQLKVTSSTVTINNINYIFRETARKLYGENDQTHEKFELVMQNKNYTDPWSSLELNFEVKWPLHIIFHPTTLKLYNKLFCYLLRIKKTHIDLHKLWLLHIKNKRKINSSVWTLRNILMFVVTNIQYYLQVDVIESQFSVLKISFSNSTEFSQITRQHSIFLSNLLSKTFILTVEENEGCENKGQHNLYQAPALVCNEGNNLVYKVILQILELCDKFCFLLSTWSDELLEPQLKQVEEIKSDCDTLMQILMRVLYELHEKVAGQHLLQLLHRLDFNRWFTKGKHLPLASS